MRLISQHIGGMKNIPRSLGGVPEHERARGGKRSRLSLCAQSLDYVAPQHPWTIIEQPYSKFISLHSFPRVPTRTGERSRFGRYVRRVCTRCTEKIERAPRCNPVTPRWGKERAQATGVRCVIRKADRNKTKIFCSKSRSPSSGIKREFELRASDISRREESIIRSLFACFKLFCSRTDDEIYCVKNVSRETHQRPLHFSHHPCAFEKLNICRKNSPSWKMWSIQSVSLKAKH